MRPVIGITPSQQNDFREIVLNKDYAEAIRVAGGLPVVLPIPGSMLDIMVKEYINVIDGLLLSGGMDLDPLSWGEEPLPGLRGIDPERDLFELTLVKEAINNGKPVLGICKGCQLLNIATGGTLYQDLSSRDKESLQHEQKAPRWYPTHNIIIEKDSLLYSILGREKIRVNSFHHQAIKEVGPDFKIVAISSDGVIESVEKKNGSFVLGVQWHPEAMWQQDENALKLFQKLVYESKHD